MYVIGYPELTTTALNINALTVETIETFTVLAVVYLALVWTLSALIRLVERRLALPEGRDVAAARLGRAGRRGTSSRRACPARCASRAFALVGSIADRGHARHADDDPLPAAAGA